MTNKSLPGTHELSSNQLAKTQTIGLKFEVALIKNKEREMEKNNLSRINKFKYYFKIFA